MKIRINAKNYPEIEARLHALQSKSTVCLITLKMIKDFADGICDFFGNAYGTRANGCTFSYCDGGAEASSYKYPRNATSITILYSHGKCFLTDLSRHGYFPGSGTVCGYRLTNKAAIHEGFLQGKALIKKKAITSEMIRKRSWKAFEKNLRWSSVMGAIGILKAYVEKGLVSPIEATQAVSHRAHQLARGLYDLSTVTNDDMLSMLPKKNVHVMGTLLPGTGLKFLQAIYDQIAIAKELTCTANDLVDQEFCILLEDLLAA